MLSQHTRQLNPLNVGDSVYIQNQAGNNPTRWDRSGVIVEIRDFDQYIVKVNGSGRLTIRNRRFLRKFEPHQLYQNHDLPSSNHRFFPDVPRNSPLPPTVTNSSSVNKPVQATTEPTNTQIQPNDQSSTSTENHSEIPHLDSSVTPQPSNLTEDLPAAPMSTSVTTDTSPRRSVRVRQPKKIYEPETGKYVVNSIK